MTELLKVLNEILNNINTERTIPEWEEFIINNNFYFLHEISFKLFYYLKRTNNIYFTKSNFLCKFPYCDIQELNTWFDTVSENSEVMTYRQFHDFLTKTEKIDVIDLIKITNIYNLDEIQNDTSINSSDEYTTYKSSSYASEIENTCKTIQFKICDKNSCD
tara:strand:- start:173 stop:655 length:483 start_codon:yes stop_codon:yes gene_type:complete